MVIVDMSGVHTIHLWLDSVNSQSCGQKVLTILQVFLAISNLLCHNLKCSGILLSTLGPSFYRIQKGALCPAIAPLLRSSNLRTSQVTFPTNWLSAQKTHPTHISIFLILTVRLIEISYALGKQYTHHGISTAQSFRSQVPPGKLSSSL